MSDVNELHPELLGIHALNAFAKHNSASRSTMFSSHFAQRLVINNPEEKRIQTGLEQEFGKYTFNVSMPQDGTILRVIPRYPQGVGENSLNFNPETLVIYEAAESREIDCFVIPHHASFHQFFGFEYQPKDALSQLHPRASFAKGTIFADSPSVGENNSYRYGLNANVAFMSIPSVSEDGVMVSKDFLDKMKFKIFETRVVDFGSSQFPLNIYGSADHYKPFPEIGDYIREDGVLMMLRSYDPDLMPVEMSIHDVREPDFIFDKGIYVRGGRGRVVDIKVISNNSPNRNLPSAICGYIGKYEDALLRYHREIVQAEEQIRLERRKMYGDKVLKISPRFQRLLVESMAITGRNEQRHRPTLQLLHRKNAIDEYRIEFTVEYEMVPNIGFKMTGCHGDKGVICKIEAPENMPVDSDGNRADIVMDAASTISRMNLGRLYEHYFCAAARDVSKNVRRMLGYQPEAPAKKIGFLKADFKVSEAAYEYLLGFYKIVSPKQYEFFLLCDNDEKLQHLVDIVNDGVYVYYPIDNPIHTPLAVKELEKFYRPTYGPVTYTGNSGRKVVTKTKVRIAPMYVMLLDKIADDWSSVSIGKLQHFGVLSPLVKAEKFAYPFRNTPVRTIGETEGRIFAGYCGREAIAEMLDRSNNPASQRNMVWNILSAEKPSNIKEVVDRTFIRLGGNRSLRLVQHTFMCAGFTTVYEPEGR